MKKSALPLLLTSLAILGSCSFDYEKAVLLSDASSRLANMDQIPETTPTHYGIGLKKKEKRKEKDESVYRREETAFMTLETTETGYTYDIYERAEIDETASLLSYRRVTKEGEESATVTDLLSKEKITPSAEELSSYESLGKSFASSYQSAVTEFHNIANSLLFALTEGFSNSLTSFGALSDGNDLSLSFEGDSFALDLKGLEIPHSDIKTLDLLYKDGNLYEANFSYKGETGWETPYEGKWTLSFERW